jgi:hypothetical protein
MRLDNLQQQALATALRQAFREHPQLPAQLELRLQARLAELAGHGTFEEQVEPLIHRMSAEDQVEHLIRAAQEICPTNKELQAFSAHVKRAEDSPQDAGLEVMVHPLNTMVEPVRFKHWLERVMGQVCRIELTTASGGIDYGTGFLIGPDVLLTNHHVVRELLEGVVEPENFVARFDYRIQVEGGQPAGVPYTLAENWLLDASPPAPWELNELLPGGNPTEEHLDIAMLRLADSPGAERGWMQLSENPKPIEPGSPLYILQHPNGDPLKLAPESHAVLEMNTARTRVRYLTNTLRGSSGAPCFNRNLDLVAIHHRSGVSPAGKYNEGVPIDTVARRLAPKLQPLLAAKPLKRREYEPVPRPILEKRLASDLVPGKLLLLAPRRGGAGTLAEAVARQTGLSAHAITFLRPPRVDCTEKAYFLNLSKDSRVKDPLSWQHWMEDHANPRHHLIVLLHDGGPLRHVSSLGKVLRAIFDESPSQFSFLAAGGENCARLRYSEHSSIFYGMKREYVPDLTPEEVGALLESVNLERRLARDLHLATGGHPGLLRDLLSQGKPRNAKEATDLLVDKSPLRQALKTRLDAEARNPPPSHLSTREVLKKLVRGEKVRAADDEEFADDFKYPEVQLYYDGIVRRGADGSTVFRCAAARTVAEQVLKAGEKK